MYLLEVIWYEKTRDGVIKNTGMGGTIRLYKTEEEAFQGLDEWCRCCASIDDKVIRDKDYFKVVSEFSKCDMFWKGRVSYFSDK